MWDKRSDMTIYEDDLFNAEPPSRDVARVDVSADGGTTRNQADITRPTVGGTGVAGPSTPAATLTAATASDDL